MSCTIPDLGRRLSELPAGVEPTEPALLDHVRDCETCARELTQRLRWFASWDRSEPSAAAIARLRLKVGTPSRRAFTPRLALAYAAAALLATGLASATGYLWQRASSAPPAALTSSQAPSEPGIASKARSEARSDPAPATSASASSPAPPEEPDSTRAEATPPSAPRPTTSAQLAETWSEAATALRQGDSQRASKALGELSRSRDTTTRDAARLALAELWMSQGKTDKAQPVLQALSKSGATPLIRKRAQELVPR